MPVVFALDRVARVKSLDRVTEALQRAEALAGSATSEVLKSSLGPSEPDAGARGPAAPPPLHATIVSSLTRGRPVEVEPRPAPTVAIEPPDDGAEAIGQIAEQLLPTLVRNGWWTLGLVSPTEGDLRRLTTAKLAVALAARLERRCVLVDADLGHPGLHTSFGLPAGPGLSDYLQRRVTLDGLFMKSGVEGLVVVAAGLPQTNPSQLLASARMHGLARELRNRFRDAIVVFDLPAVLGGAAALEVARGLDALLMVGGSNAAAADDIGRARAALAGLNLIGVVANDRPVLDGGNAPRRGLLGRLLGRA